MYHGMLACVLCQGWVHVCWFQSWLVSFRWGTLASSSCCCSSFMLHLGWNCLESWVNTYYSSFTPFDAYFHSKPFLSLPHWFSVCSILWIQSWIWHECIGTIETKPLGDYKHSQNIVFNNTNSLYGSVCSLQCATRTSHVRAWVGTPPLRTSAWRSSPSSRSPLVTTGTA